MILEPPELRQGKYKKKGKEEKKREREGEDEEVLYGRPDERLVGQQAPIKRGDGE